MRELLPCVFGIKPILTIANHCSIDREVQNRRTVLSPLDQYGKWTRTTHKMCCRSGTGRIASYVLFGSISMVPGYVQSQFYEYAYTA